MKTPLLILLLMGPLCSIAAEMRVWEDKNGNRYEAEFVRELFGKMTLRTKDGTEVRIPVEDFSEHDQKYMRVMVPPNVSIEVDDKTWKKPKLSLDEEGNVGSDEEEERSNSFIMTKGLVTVTKESKRVFTSRLKAELFLIAEEIDGDNYALMSRTESSFLLGEHNDETHVFSSDSFENIEFTEYFGQPRGEEYAGYLVVVSDAQGNILQTKTDLGDWIEKPEVIKNLRELCVRGAPSLCSRHFDKTGQKTEVPRPNFYFPIR